MITQREIQLAPYRRGIHIITSEISYVLGDLPQQGLLNIFIKHTSAGLAINENADPAVRKDFEAILNQLVPEEQPFYTHKEEGPDDMPSHVKSTMTGHSLTIPISDGELNLGTWQGIYLCEFRNRASGRKLVVTIYQ
jgi:secondary thiamine-phosphate synthase enzyme